MDSIAIAEQFQLQGPIAEVRAYGDGNINETFLVVMASGSERFILQRLNRQVFPQPELVMANLRTVTDHLRGRLAAEPVDLDFQVAAMVPTRSGGDFLIDERRDLWRVSRYLARTRTLSRLANHEQGRQVGLALGRFHRLLSDLDPRRLYDTLPGFHETPRYLDQYDAVVGQHGREDAFCRRFIEARRGHAKVLEEARRCGVLARRVMHGDPKVNNFLFREDDDQVVSLIDLDTVKPGLVHYDLGDCLRSCCNSAGEETVNLEQVHFDLDCCRALLGGYLAEGGRFLAEAESAFIYDALRLITFELGLRFYSDYLAGNIYFRVTDPEQNLRRARVQFALVERIEAREKEIRSLVGALR